MDTSLVRVVCANCDANYRLPGEIVRGKVADFCCSNCGAVIEVNGMAIEMVAPTRPGGSAVGPVILTPEPPAVEPVAQGSIVVAPYETPPHYARAKPAAVPPPPTDAFVAHRSMAQPPAAASFSPIPMASTPTIPLRAVMSAPTTTAAPVSSSSSVNHSSMPPPMSVPMRGATETLRPTPIVGEIAPPNDLRDEESRSGKGWMIWGTLAAAIAVGFIGRAIGSASSPAVPPAAAATLAEIDPGNPVANRLQPGDFRGTATDPALSAAAPATVVPAKATPQEISVESLKPERRKKKGKAKTGVDSTDSAEIAEETAAPSPSIVELSAIEPPAPPAAPEGVEFNRDAAQSALEDAAALAATCRQDDTPSGAVRVAVTFVATGKVTQALVESGPVRGTPTGSCVASKFRTTQIPAFSGSRVTVHKTLSF